MCRGEREITTFRKLPMTEPKINTSTQITVSYHSIPVIYITILSFLERCNNGTDFNKWGLGQRPKWGRRGDSPRILPLSGGKGQLGKDAEIRTHKALHDAKPPKCPKGDRDIKSALQYKISFCFNLNAVKQRMDILPHIAAFFKYRRQVYH